MKIFAAICDDDIYFLRKTKENIEKYFKEREIDIQVDEYVSGEELLSACTDAFPYVLVFLDMKMGDKNGIEIAEIINRKSPETMIVFITSYIDFAISGYKVGAARYLLKNDNNFESEFEECMDNAIIKLGLKEKIEEFNFVGGKEIIKIDDIIYIESNLHRLFFT